jgi:hypothetical protein
MPFANWADHYNGEVKKWSTTCYNFSSDSSSDGNIATAEQALFGRPARHYMRFLGKVNGEMNFL